MIPPLIKEGQALDPTITARSRKTDHMEMDMQLFNVRGVIEYNADMCSARFPSDRCVALFQ